MAPCTTLLLTLLLLVPSILTQSLSKPTNSGSLSTSSISSKPVSKPSSFNFFSFGSPGANPEGQASNPFPIRTMIGNLYFRLRQHKTPIMIIPPLLRIVYQYRRPIIGGLSSAFQALSASPVAGAGEVLSKGSAAAAATGGLASAASQAVPALAGSSYPLFNMAPGYSSLLPALGAAGGAAFPYPPLAFA